MHKFKIGDTVGFVSRDSILGRPKSELVGPYVVQGLEPGDKVRFTNGAWMPADRLVYWPGYEPEGKADVAKDSWNYAEADRLEQAARSAIAAYNAYIDKKPEKLYIPMYLPD